MSICGVVVSIGYNTQTCSLCSQIAHGVTRHTSALEYQYQSGGMNEGFSDIVGAVVETLVNDSIDQPDFDVGEMLGNKLRSMESPREGGRSIDSVCDYSSSYDVHHTSGPLNKAYVTAVRVCESSGCSDRAGCTILIGTIFMYGNIQLLTTYSTYLDGATATCSIVDEYYDVKSPDTQCGEDSIVSFIKQGWASVNVALDDNCKSSTCCSGNCYFAPALPEPPTPSPTLDSPTSSPQPTVEPSEDPTAAPISGDSDIDSSVDEGIILRIFKLIFGGFLGIFGVKI